MLITVARTQTAQFVTYRFRLVLVVEELLPSVVSRPPAAAAIIPAGDRRISLGSKRDGVGHRALLTSEGCRCIRAIVQRCPTSNRRHQA